MPVRKNLLRLIPHINMLNIHPTEDSPEYKLLVNLLNDDQIAICQAIRLRTPYTMEEIAEKAKMPVEKVRKEVDEMLSMGFMEYEKDKVKLPVFAPGSMEMMMMQTGFAENHPEVAENFIAYVHDLTENFASLFPQGKGLVVTLPVEKAIESEPRRVDIETVRYWVDKYQDHMSVTRCQCRHAAAMRGQIGADLEGEWCIQLGDFAESCIRTKRARRIDKEEAYKIIYKAEKMGYVHEVTNIDGPTNSLFICECHPEACLAMMTARLCDTPNLMRSNYVASVDKSKCVACGECMEVCPANAAKLSEKLCTKVPIKIHTKPLPDDHPWPKSMWTPDYRENKKDVQPETGTSPCKAACPAHISVQAYLHLAHEGKYLDALKMIKKNNPLPAVCGRICNHRCENECTLGTIARPVAIDDVKQFIADKELENENRYIPEKKFDHGNKVAVIGAGPAGISAAYYAAVLGHDVTVFDKNEKPGGMLRYGIPSFRLEKTVIDAEVSVLEDLGVHFVYGMEIGRDKTLDDLRNEGFKAFYLAIGAQGGRKLNIPGENSQGVLSGVDFLRQVNSGKTDGLHGKVVVIGGGNVAADVARAAIRAGAASVTMYSLEQRNEMPAAMDEVEEAEAEGIHVVNGWGPKEILAEKNSVHGIVLKKCTQVKDPETGRFHPLYDESTTIHMDCDFVLAAIGQSIEWGDLLKGSRVKLNRNQTACADKLTYQTEEPDIFVGGDCCSGPRFAIDAIAAGKEGADSLHRFSWGHSLTIGRDRRIFSEIDKDNIIVDSYDRPARQIRRVNKDNALTFHEEKMNLTEEQVKAETSRCLGCGAAYVDESRCLGCGLCTTRCEFDAIHLRKVTNVKGCTYEEYPIEIGKNVVKRAARIAVTAAKEKLSGTRDA